MREECIHSSFGFENRFFLIMALNLAATKDRQFGLPGMDTNLPQGGFSRDIQIIAAIAKCVVPGFRSTVTVRMAKTHCTIRAVVIEEFSHGTPSVVPRMINNS
jgi:hypothetical protein